VAWRRFTPITPAPRSVALEASPCSASLTGSRWELDDMRKNIADCFNYVVHFKRSGELRHVSEILQIHGFENNDYVLNRVF
jgi:Flp pilus assembly CpaF family ATPase